MHDRAFVEHLSRLHRDGVPVCTVTIVDSQGSIPQETGASAAFGRDGLLFGTIGGGRVEAHCAAIARELLEAAADGHTRFERLNLYRDLGMTCAGEVALYYEAHRPDRRWTIVVFGAGHVAQKLCRFLIELDCSVVCIDTRREWLERLPDSDRLERRLVADYAEGVDAVCPDASVVVMTMGHATDMPVLEAIARKGTALSYLGVIGSDTKAAIMRRQLRESGIASQFIDAIVCPLGDKVGDNTPPEIAVGVLSQLVKLRRRTPAA